MTAPTAPDAAKACTSLQSLFAEQPAMNSCPTRWSTLIPRNARSTADEDEADSPSVGDGATGGSTDRTGGTDREWVGAPAAEDRVEIVADIDGAEKVAGAEVEGGTFDRLIEATTVRLGPV